MTGAPNPHLQRPLVHAGAPLAQDAVAAVLVHGRDQDPAFMLELVGRLALDDVAYVLPEAHGRSWYPGRYTDPVDDNQPWLSHALDACRRALDAVAAAGVPPRRTVLVGFSQGGCLTAELVFTAPAGYGGVAVLTGALIGPRGTPRSAPAGLEGLPLFLGTAVEDAWVALGDVESTARAFSDAGASVTLRRYDEPEHAIYDDEVDAVRELLIRAGRR